MHRTLRFMRIAATAATLLLASTGAPAAPKCTDTMDARFIQGELAR